MAFVTRTMGGSSGSAASPPLPPPPAGLYVATNGSDSNAGTAASPFLTITKASSVATPGITIYVGDGTYNGSFTTSTSGTLAGGTITFKSINKWGAKLIPASSTSDTTGWAVTGNYVVVDGFELDGQSSLGWRYGISMQAANVTVKNCHVHHIGNASACDSNGGAGIHGDGFLLTYTNQSALNNVVHHIGTINDIGGCGTINGIYISCQGFTVKNNLVYKIGGDGITSYHDATNGLVVNNTVFQCGRGITLSSAGFYHLTAGGPHIIENNLVYDNDPNHYAGSNLTGIGIYGTTTGSSTIANNCSVSNALGQNIYMQTGSGTTSSNITTGTPGFVNYVSSGSGDYHLAAGTQCIDKGLATYAPPTDLDGVTRPQGAAVDIGCYER